MASVRRVTRPIRITLEAAGRGPRRPIRFILSVLALVITGSLVVGATLAAARLAPPADGQLAARAWPNACLLSQRAEDAPPPPPSVDGMTLADLILEVGMPRDGCVDYVIRARTTLILLWVRWEDTPIQAAIRVRPGAERVLPDAPVDTLTCAAPGSRATMSHGRPWQGFVRLSAYSSCPQSATVTP